MSRSKSSAKNCANPVFEEWLVELRDDAVARDLQSKHTYTKCLSALRRYPMPLKSGKDCMILEGFGDKICKLLDEKLEKFQRNGGVLHVEQDDFVFHPPNIASKSKSGQSGNAKPKARSKQKDNFDDEDEELAVLDDLDRENIRPATNSHTNLRLAPVEQSRPPTAKTKSLLKMKTTQRSTDADCEDDDDTLIEKSVTTTTTRRRPGKKRSSKEYRPGFRSGGYAILITLYNHEIENTQEENSNYMLKADLIKEAQAHCNSSFTYKQDPNSHYTAWSSMSTLIKKEYVIKENKLPAQYRLTDAGRRLAIKLINGIEDDDDDDGDRHENSDDTSSRLDRDRSSSPKSARYDLPRTESVQSFAPLSIDADSQNSRLQFDAWPQPSRTTDINDDVIQLSDNDDNEIVEISEDPAPFQRLKQQPEVSHKSPESFKTKSKQESTKSKAFDLSSDDELPDLGAIATTAKTPIDLDDVFLTDDALNNPDLISTQREIEREIQRTTSMRNKIADSSQASMRSTASSMMTKSSSLLSSSSSSMTLNTMMSSQVSTSSTFSSKPPAFERTTSMKSMSSSTSSSSMVTSSTTYTRQSSFQGTTGSTELPNTIFKMNPGTFDVILWVDNCEQSHAKRQELLLDELKKSGIKFETGKLNVGDFVWIARSRSGSNGMATDVVLNYIVERKRMDDLCSSIIDGRYKEQKFRLKKCGITRPIYLIEDFGSMKHMSLPEKSLVQADVNTQIIDHFTVHHTTDPKDSAAYLIAMTKYLERAYKNLTLYACLKSELDAYTKRLGQHGQPKHLNYLLTFDEFNEFSNKNKPLTVREMFAKWLMKIQGVSQEKCLPIVEAYPTLALLMKEYSKCDNESKREKLLANLKFGSAQRNIGPVISKLISQLFYSNQPLS